MQATLEFDGGQGNLDLSARIAGVLVDTSAGVADRESVQAAVGADGGDVHLVIDNHAADSAVPWSLSVEVLRP